MKCIELDSGDVVRAHDSEADRLVKYAGAQYTSKQQWKAGGRKYLGLTQSELRRVRISQREMKGMEDTADGTTV